jgi:hypothetical protein
MVSRPAKSQRRDLRREEITRTLFRGVGGFRQNQGSQQYGKLAALNLEHHLHADPEARMRF